MNQKLAQCFSQFGWGSVATAIARNLGIDRRKENAPKKCAILRLRAGYNLLRQRKGTKVSKDTVYQARSPLDIYIPYIPQYARFEVYTV